MSNPTVIGSTPAGAVLGISASGSTYTTTGEVSEYTLPQPKYNFDDVTTLSSPISGGVVVKQNQVSSIDPGEFSATLVYTAKDAGYLLTQTAFLAGTPYAFQLTLPIGPGQTTAGTATFSGIVQEYPTPSGNPQKVAVVKLSVKCTSLLSFTPGS